MGNIILSCSGLLLFPRDEGDKEIFSSPAPLPPLPHYAVILPEK
ncbi:hypothetical protein COO91_02516 [Nostoc flagelliforme CCNUN1]|uniref:Uncharacterized protein n=1 Tax=Nostoc flagelliforme CCNUN1 TaxID=2038116 RepID=A0A2K8SMF6_9NOSO|nr:hypothetical protein COO91_02516 [Nostoc flagelliforme CCNUN1]